MYINAYLNDTSSDQILLLLDLFTSFVALRADDQIRFTFDLNFLTLTTDGTDPRINWSSFLQ